VNDEKVCPVCRHPSRPESQRCDCGYDFAVQQHPGRSLPTGRPAAEPPRLMSVIGLGLLFVPAGAILGAVAAGLAFRVFVAGQLRGGGDMGVGGALMALQWLEVGAVLGGAAGLLAAPLIAYSWPWTGRGDKKGG
jgi:hypothetical protein